MVAAGLTLIFGVLRIAKFAHGSFFVVAPFTTYHHHGRGASNPGFLLALLLAPLTIAATGVVLERFLLRPIARRPHQYQLILTYGLTLVFADLVRILWGSQFRQIPGPEALEGSVSIGRQLPLYYVVIMLAGGGDDAGALAPTDALLAGQGGPAGGERPIW